MEQSKTVPDRDRDNQIHADNNSTIDTKSLGKRRSSIEGSNQQAQLTKKQNEGEDKVGKKLKVVEYAENPVEAKSQEPEIAYKNVWDENEKDESFLMNLSQSGKKLKFSLTQFISYKDIELESDISDYKDDSSERKLSDFSFEDFF